jgi:hypothetical protein
VRSLGFDIDELERTGQLVVLAFRVDPSEIVQAGIFDFEPIFAILDDAIQQVGAKRVVLDTIEVIFGAFGNDTIVRAELIRLVRWLDDRGVTVVLTGERGSQGGEGLCSRTRAGPPLTRSWPRPPWSDGSPRRSASSSATSQTATASSSDWRFCSPAASSTYAEIGI